MQVLVQFYADAAPAENPYGLSAEYPWRCTEHEDDVEVQIPLGQQLMTAEEYAALKATVRQEYETKLAAYVAANGGE